MTSDHPFTGPPASDVSFMCQESRHLKCVGSCGCWHHRAPDAGLRALVAELREEVAEVTGHPRLKKSAHFMVLAGAQNDAADRIEAALNASAAAVCSVAREKCEVTDAPFIPFGPRDTCDIHGGNFPAVAEGEKVSDDNQTTSDK